MKTFDNVKFKGTFRDYQKRVLDNAEKYLLNKKINIVAAPGSGKTMLAKSFPSILPDMTFDEALEVTKIHSVSGTLDSKQGIVLSRPFRAPHHTTTTVTMVGGGRNSKPGEVSLAHNGVLFLDEAVHFDRRVLEIL